MTSTSSAPVTTAPECWAPAASGSPASLTGAITTTLRTPATVPVMYRIPAVVAAALCSRIVSSFTDTEPVHLAPDCVLLKGPTRAEGPRRAFVHAGSSIFRVMVAWCGGSWPCGRLGVVQASSRQDHERAPGYDWRRCGVASVRPPRVRRARRAPRRPRRAGGVHRYRGRGGGLPWLWGADVACASAHGAGPAWCAVRCPGGGAVGEEAVAVHLAGVCDGDVHRAHHPGPAVLAGDSATEGEGGRCVGRRGPGGRAGRARVRAVVADGDASVESGGGGPGREGSRAPEAGTSPWHRRVRFRTVRYWRDEHGTWRRIAPWMLTFTKLYTAQVIGVVDGRDAAAVKGWLRSQPRWWRRRVAVGAIDPSAAFRSAVRHLLPKARVSVDHFHLVKLANDMVTAVRRGVC